MIKSAFNVQYANRFRRFLAFLLDLFLYIIFFVPVTIALLLISFEQKTILYFCLYMLFLIGFFQVYLTIRLGGSVGKLTFDIKVVNREKAYITWGQAIVRIFPYVLTGAYLIVFLNYMLVNLPTTTYPTSITEAIFTVAFFGKQYFAHPSVIIVVGVLLLDYLLFFAIPGRQTLHDLLAGTYTITRESFYIERDNKNPYLMNIIGQTILLKNYRSNSVLAKMFPQDAVVKSYVKIGSGELNMFLLDLSKEVKLEERNIATKQLVLQLQDEHTSLRTGRNQVVYLLAPPADIDFTGRYEVFEDDLQFLDFVVVD